MILPEQGHFAELPSTLKANEALILVAKAEDVLRALPAERLALPLEENERIARYKSANDRQARHAAHGLLRHCLGMFLSRAPRDIHWTRDEKGRPFLADGSDHKIDFNLSHGGRWIAAGLSRAGRIGVDVQEASEPFDWQTVGRAYLHPDEIEAIHQLAAANQSTAALELWCLKEAFLKATGEGLATRPNLLHPHYIEAIWRLRHQGYELKAASFLLPDGTCAAWACELAAEPRVIRL
jgi:4'-phosphopantetheinyl transferase